MNGALIVPMVLVVVAVGLLGFWVLTKVGFGPADDASAQDDDGATPS